MKQYTTSENKTSYFSDVRLYFYTPSSKADVRRQESLVLFWEAEKLKTQSDFWSLKNAHFMQKISCKRFTYYWDYKEPVCCDRSERKRNNYSNYNKIVDHRTPIFSYFHKVECHYNVFLSDFLSPSLSVAELVNT